MRIREKLFEVDPFEGLSLDEVRPDRQGWGSDHPVFRDYIQKHRPRILAEVGVWKGRCVLNMARYCRQLQLDSEILCIDTWLGSPEHWLRRDDHYRSLNIRHGMPQLYWTFMRNVIEEDAADIITPMPMTSEMAFHVLKRLNVSIDLVHIDAGHEFESVQGDLLRFWELLGPGGVLIGDDYGGAWPEVVRAADEFSRTVERQLKVHGRKYVLVKN